MINAKESLSEVITKLRGKFDKNAWIGDQPSFNADIIDLYSSSNGRVDPSFHGKYDAVWFVQTQLFLYPLAWKLAIDESVRLLGEFGVLVVRTRDINTGTLFGLKSHLARSYNINCNLIDQIKGQDESVISIFSINRKNLESYLDRNWTIGILSNGAKNENICNLISKALEIKDDCDLDFIICGPVINSPEGANCRFYNVGNEDNLARIGEKKNIIIKEAKYENILLIHDRYQLNSDFFHGFDIFGYDFDFVTVRQSYESGKLFPAYVGFKSKEFRWQSPLYSSDSRDLFDGHFLNGGLIVIKKTIGAFLNFNTLLLHNEAEDVEISFMLSMHGVTPRYNLFSSAVTVGVGENHTNSFKKISRISSRRLDKKALKVMLYIWQILPLSVQTKFKRSFFFEKAKNLFLG